jgi:hypothetical protein
VKTPTISTVPWPIDLGEKVGGPVCEEEGPSQGVRRAGPQTGSNDPTMTEMLRNTLIPAAQRATVLSESPGRA